jgi:cytoskeletal protein CcmA (bactofilin family)
MWNKREDDPTYRLPSVPPQPPVPAAGPPPVVGEGRHEPAAIGASISILGDLKGEEDLTILGRVEGKIDLPQHSVVIGRSGRVTADIHAKLVSVEGEVRGNLFAGEQILIRRTATMLGNLTAPRVSLEDGCRFKGSVDMEAQQPVEKVRPAMPAQAPAPTPASRPPAGGEVAPKPASNAGERPSPKPDTAPARP